MSSRPRATPATAPPALRWRRRRDFTWRGWITEASRRRLIQVKDGAGDSRLSWFPKLNTVSREQNMPSQQLEWPYKKFVFASLLGIGYVGALAAVVYPFVMYTWF